MGLPVFSPSPKKFPRSRRNADVDEEIHNVRVALARTALVAKESLLANQSDTQYIDSMTKTITKLNASANKYIKELESRKR